MFLISKNRPSLIRGRRRITELEEFEKPTYFKVPG
jgi:hypothetical protein